MNLQPWHAGHAGDALNVLTVSAGRLVKGDTKEHMNIYYCLEKSMYEPSHFIH